MIWVIKSDVGDYLHAWSTGLHCRVEHPEWDGSQSLAHRFEHRNQAILVARHLGAAGAKLVRLRRGHQVSGGGDGT